jgi:hypothetical protein
MYEIYQIQIDKKSGLASINSTGRTTQIDSYSLPTELNELKHYLSNPKSEALSYRIIKKSVLELAVECVNKAITDYSKNLDTLSYLSSNGLIEESEVRNRMKAISAFSLEGYYNKRLINITNKVAAVLSILAKHKGSYNLKWYYYLTYKNKDTRNYKYKDITYIPAQELKDICGTNSATDYTVIKYCLTNAGIIKELNNHWLFKTEYYDEINGTITVTGEGVAKPYWINPNITKILNNKEVIAIDSNGIFDNLSKTIESTDDNYFGAIAGLLKLQVSDQIYNSALVRLGMDSVKRVVKEGYEESNNDQEKYEIVNSIPVDLFDASGAFCCQVMLSIQTANIIVAIHDFDLFTLLRYTIDDYSKRLHTSITRLKSEAREHLRFNDGENIADIDIQSCQPMIFCSLLAQYGFPELASEVGNKDFYKYLASHINQVDYDLYEFKNDERKKYKLLFMKSDYSTGAHFRKFVKSIAEIVNKKSGMTRATELINLMYALADGKSELNIKEGFETNYRTQMTKNGFKRNSYLPSALPKRMQSKEVEIMYGKNGVCEKLNSAGIPFTTIHDAILVPESAKEWAHKIMQETFSEKLNCANSGLQIVAKMEILTPNYSKNWTWNGK